MNAVNDTKLGSDALVYFHNRALQYPAYQGTTFERLKQILSEKSHGEFLAGFGFAIENSGLSDSKVEEAMQDLADHGQGLIPSKWNDFFNALNRDSSGFSFEALAFTAGESVKDIGSGLKAIGDKTIEIGKYTLSLSTMLPFVAFAGVVGYVYFRVKK